MKKPKEEILKLLKDLGTDRKLLRFTKRMLIVATDKRVENLLRDLRRELKAISKKKKR